MLYPLYAHFSLPLLPFTLTYSKRGTGERVYYRGPFAETPYSTGLILQTALYRAFAVPLYPACPRPPRRPDPSEGRPAAPRTSPLRRRAGRASPRAEPHNRKSRNCNFRIAPENRPKSRNAHASDAKINANRQKTPLRARRAVRTQGFMSKPTRAFLGPFFARFQNRAPHRLQTPRNTPENAPPRRPYRPGRNTPRRT